MHHRRTVLKAALAGLFLLVSTVAAPAAAEEDAKAFVNRVANAAMETMTAKNMSDQERVAKFRTLFVANVDLPEIGRFVLGRYWRTATPEQQHEFIKLFEDIVVLTWSTRFKDYAGGMIHEVTNVTQDGERGLVVDSLVKADKQQEPIMLQWRLRQPDNGFKVVDLVVAGSSMAITYRSEYASVVQSNGGKVDGLLAAMRRKVAQLEAERASAAAAPGTTKAN
ncbi:MAG: phospholipid-binding protein MlaC [Actinomycetota bacterium]